MTPPTPTRDTFAGRAYNNLRNLARREGRDPAEYITLYALEGFLARFAVSAHAGEFILKGGDPIWSGPTEVVFPLLLGGTLRLAGYPDHMVLAEKSSPRSNVVSRIPVGATSLISQRSPAPVASAGKTFTRRSTLSPAIATLTSNPWGNLSWGCRLSRNASGQPGAKSRGSSSGLRQVSLTCFRNAHYSPNLL